MSRESRFRSLSGWCICSSRTGLRPATAAAGGLSWGAGPKAARPTDQGGLSMQQETSRAAGAIVCFALAAGACFVWAGASAAEERELVVGRWYPALETGLTLTQSAYSDNWAGGDKGSIVWTFITNAELESRLSTKVHWNNKLKLAYGQTHQQATDEDGGRSWDAPEKSTDLIDFETLFRFTLGWVVDPYAAGRFESQFQDASDPYGRTLALNPMKFKESAGFARKFINEEERELLSRVGFSVRQSYRKFFTDANLTDAGVSDDDTFAETSVDGGLEWVTDYKAKILQERVAWTSKLTVYQPVFYSGNDEFEKLTAEDLQEGDPSIDPDVEEYTTTMDIDWENIFTTQVTKWISVNLYVRWLYDKYDNTVPPVLTADDELDNRADVKAAIRKKGQFKQTLSIGITYRFF
ncbi:MAG: DUF3078 domain-containing protein [Candidatus Eisenbacteria bacterium]|nr:DUF3078 domain-containing protein [Candidatus Eisenbacteria bacterium]